VLREQEAGTIGTYRKGFDIALDVVRPPGGWRQLFLLRPKKNCLVPVTWVIIIGEGVPLSDELDTRPGKILDPRLIIYTPCRYKSSSLTVDKAIVDIRIRPVGCCP